LYESLIACIIKIGNQPEIYKFNLEKLASNQLWFKVGKVDWIIALMPKNEQWFT